MARKKCFDDGGLSFADMSAEDRKAAADAAIADIDARQAARSAEASVKATPRRRAQSVKVSAGDTRENLRDLDMSGADTGYSDTEARRNMARAGTRHAVGVMNLEDRGYSGTEAKRNLNRAVSGMKAGGKVSSASKRADGCAIRGKTKGRMV